MTFTTARKEQNAERDETQDSARENQETRGQTRSFVYLFNDILLAVNMDVV